MENMKKIDFSEQYKLSEKYTIYKTKYDNQFSKKEFLISKKFTDEIKEIILDDGHLLIFKTENFLHDEFSTPERIGIYGSLTNEIDSIKIYKNLI